ncbi:MAG: hypothetical protein KKD07_09665 [Candidatus Omnitrophica bacterium]|nr:hypothetical protein [Candidatus Omnitrophota bacterium]
MILSTKTLNLTKLIIVLLTVLLSSFFLFYRLGHYPLWDDEATTAMFGQSVWETGDTSAIRGHNLIAYKSGYELKNLKNRYIPPLQFYLAAPFTGTIKNSAFAARFPFAVCGLLTIFMMFLWLWRAKQTLLTWILMSIGILGNVSLMLYFRQCRYYAPTILLTMVLAFLYNQWNTKKRTLILFSFISLLLLSSNYLAYVAAYVCFFVDYFIWQKEKYVFKKSDLLLIFIPQILLAGLFLFCFNPIGREATLYYIRYPWLMHKISQLLGYLREINSCEFGVGILILIAPLMYFKTKDKRLLRCTFILFVYTLVIAILSPQKSIGFFHSFATIRYLAPIIPLCIFTTAISVEAITKRLPLLAVLIGSLAFGTNILHGGAIAGTNKVGDSKIIYTKQFRSTIFEFTKELISPNRSTYRALANWINDNLHDKESVWVLPDFAAYPLMYHAPKALYAWQLEYRSSQFKDLPEIHFRESVPPDYIIAFGPHLLAGKHAIKKLEGRGFKYEILKTFNLFWYDLIRPELFWHSFQNYQENPNKLEIVSIFKRTS